MRRARLALTALLAILFVAELLPLGHLFRPGSNGDFSAYYLAAVAIADGHSPYDEAYAARTAQRRGIHRTPYVYLPPLAVALLPLAHLDYATAAALWKKLSIACLLIAVYLLGGIARVRTRYRIALMACAFLVPAVHTTIEIGQNNLVLLLLLTCAALAGSRLELGRQSAGGLALGTAVLAKAFLPLPVLAAWIASRRWAALASAAAAIVGATALSIGVVGWEAVTSWPSAMASSTARPEFYLVYNQSLEAVMNRFCVAGTYSSARFGRFEWIIVPALFECGRAGKIAGLALGAAILGWSWWVCRGARTPEGVLFAFAVLLTASLVATPIVWEHYYVVLLLPFAVACRHRDTLPMTAVTAAAVLLMLQRYWPFAIFLRTPFALAFGCAGTLVLWGALVSAARQHVRPGAA
jgi:hypothetical protein